MEIPRWQHNQIDHFLIDYRHINNVLDVRSHRGANADSDHYLTIAKLRCRISSTRFLKSVDFIKHDTQKIAIPERKQTYEERIQEKLSENAIGYWEECKLIIQEVAMETIGKCKGSKENECFDK